MRKQILIILKRDNIFVAMPHVAPHFSTISIILIPYDILSIRSIIGILSTGPIYIAKNDHCQNKYRIYLQTCQILNWLLACVNFEKMSYEMQATEVVWQPLTALLIYRSVSNPATTSN